MTSPTDPSRANNARQSPPEPVPAPDSTARPAASVTPPFTDRHEFHACDDGKPMWVVPSAECERLERSHQALVAALEQAEQALDASLSVFDELDAVTWDEDSDIQSSTYSTAQDDGISALNRLREALTAARALLEAGR